MTCKIGQSTDIQGIITLQAKNLYANLSVAQRLQQGFVTTPFTVAQLDALLAEEGIFVAENEGEVVGYCFAASWQFFSQWAIFPYMVSRFDSYTFDNEHLTLENSFQYGPVCIDSAFRGSGLFPRLFEVMRHKMSERYPIGGTFINQINKRSVKAHTEKLDLVIVDEFGFNDNLYYALAFRTK
jgi:hypothetical protein